MKAPTPLRSLLLAAALLLSAGGASHLAAQTLATTSTTATGEFINAPILRTYTGTVTQTSAAGVVTTGTFNLSYHKGGYLYSVVTLNGTGQVYSGELLPSAVTLRLAPSGLKQTRTSGVIGYTSITPAQGGNVAVVFTDHQLPVYVDKTVAYGGVQNEDGSTLTFRATRDAK